MTKLTKSVLMTIFSAILIVLTALGIMLTAPATAKAEELPDYLNWTRTEAKAGDLLANRYVLFSKNELKDDYFMFYFDYDMMDAIEQGASYKHGQLNLLQNDDGSGRLFAYLDEGNTEYEMLKKLENEEYYVFYITVYKTNFNTSTSGGVSSLTATSTLSEEIKGMYFIEDNGATLPEGGETPENGTLSEITGVNYNAVYPQKGDKFDNTAYLCVPVTVDEECIISFEGGKYIGIKGYDEVTFEGEKLEPMAVTNRYGVKAYVYDVSSIPANLTVSMIAGPDGLDVYTLVLKTGAEPETPTPNPSNPGNGGNEDPSNPPSEGPGDETPEDKTPQWIKDLDKWFAENTGIVLGSSGTIILLAVVLFILLRR